MKELRIIIAGSRDFNDYNKLNVSMREILGDRNFDVDKIVIVSGTARGADKMGEQFAENNGLGIKRFPADWDGLGKRASYVRNADMAKYSVPSSFLNEVYKSLNLEKIKARLIENLENEMADKIANKLITEYSNDIKQIMSNRELREDLRFYARDKIKAITDKVSE